MGTLCKNWTQWLIETRFSALTEEMKVQTLNWLDSVGTAVVSMAQLKPGDTVLDIGTGTGLLAFKALDQLEAMGGSGKVIFSDKFKDCLESCESFIKDNEIKTQYEFLNSPCDNFDLKDNSIDKALMRSVLVHIVDKQPSINEIYRVLKPGAYFCAFEPIMQSNTRTWELLDSSIDNFEGFKKAENEIMTDATDSICNFDDVSLKRNLENAGFSDTSTRIHVLASSYVVTRGMVPQWFLSPPSPDRPTMKQRFMKYFDEKTVDKYISDVQNYLEGREISLKTNSLLIHATK